MSVENNVVEAVMDIIDSLDNFALIRRGALGTEAGIVCEIAPSTVESVFMDKNSYIALDLTLNAKHTNLKTVSDTLNNISDHLTRLHSYPSGNGWEIVDISRGSPTIPTVIGRDEHDDWLMASSVVVKYYRKDEIE